MPMYLLTSYTDSEFLQYIMHLTSKITIILAMSKIKGRKQYRNNLNSLFEGVNAFISYSSTKQSNEKNVSFGDPNLSVCSKMEEKLAGNSILNVIQAAINCM